MLKETISTDNTSQKLSNKIGYVDNLWKMTNNRFKLLNVEILICIGHFQ